MVCEALLEHVFKDPEKHFCVEDDTLCIQTIIDGEISICTAAGIERICFDDMEGITITKAGKGSQ